jgi:hypothetical protein
VEERSGTHEVAQRLHDPFTAAACGCVTDDADERELGAHAQGRPLTRDARGVFLVALLGRKPHEGSLGRRRERAAKAYDYGRCKCGWEPAVQGRDDLRGGARM